MINGHKDVRDGKLVTVVSSCEYLTDYIKFAENVALQDEKNRKYNEHYISTPMDHLIDVYFTGFKKPIHFFYHDDEAQRDAFIAEWGIIEKESLVRARDAHSDMLSAEEYIKQQETEQHRQEMIAKTGDENYGRVTIGEMFGLDQHDPWDRRSDAEKEADAQGLARAMERATHDLDNYTGEFTMDVAYYDRLAAEKANPDIAKGDPATEAEKLKNLSGQVELNPDGSINLSSIFATKGAATNITPTGSTTNDPNATASNAPVEYNFDDLLGNPNASSSGSVEVEKDEIVEKDEFNFDDILSNESLEDEIIEFTTNDEEDDDEEEDDDYDHSDDELEFIEASELIFGVYDSATDPTGMGEGMCVSFSTRAYFDQHNLLYDMHVDWALEHRGIKLPDYLPGEDSENMFGVWEDWMANSSSGPFLYPKHITKAQIIADLSAIPGLKFDQSFDDYLNRK